MKSSGSVINIFTEQISLGGPVTISDPKAERFFMTIDEASSLIIESTKLNKNKSIFLLDMGKPVLIIELAKRMIKLSGKKVFQKNDTKGSDNIEIIYTGLKKGEKISEDLYSGELHKTEINKIYEVFDKPVSKDIVIRNLNELKNNINNYDEVEIKKLISIIVNEYSF